MTSPNNPTLLPVFAAHVFPALIDRQLPLFPPTVIVHDLTDERTRLNTFRGTKLATPAQIAAKLADWQSDAKAGER